jgi:two-component system, LytTR family, sensor kinase
MPPLIRKLGRLVLRFRLLHIAYWAFNFLGLIHDRMERFHEPFLTHLPDAIISTGTIMACVYGIVYGLIPRYLRKNKNTAFILLSFGAILLTCVVYALLLDVYTWITEGLHLSNKLILALSHFFETIISVGIFTTVILVYYWYEADQRNRQFEQAKLEAELNFLKAQTNPHFLFNALNSIYVLIDIDKQQAADTLLRFSDLLRYQLYECSSSKVSVQRELDFLQDYIGLETMRYGEFVKVSYKRPEQVPHFPIEPFLLLPFVENAFKHVSKRPAGENWISIEAQVQEDHFAFRVANTCEEAVPGDVRRPGGIGLQNVKRRLQLLYPDRHQLDIDHDKGHFKVQLKIYADEDELHHHR